jgi:hypothetical protein
MAVQKILLSPCHQAVIDGSEEQNGVFVGWCRECGTAVTRYNAATWKQEWLDGRSPRTTDTLREVEEHEWTVL